MCLLKTVHVRRSDEQHDGCKQSEKERKPGKDYGDSHYIQKAFLVLAWVLKKSYEQKKKTPTILNPLINTRYIQGVFYSIHNITWKLYSIQIGINPRTPFSVKDGQRDEHRKQPSARGHQQNSLEEQSTAERIGTT